MASDERLRELEEKYENFTVYDNRGSKIGKVDDLFVDEKDHEEYIGVKMGFFGMRSTLIPTEIIRVNEQDRTIEVSESKDHVKEAPSFDDDDDVTGEYEERIRSHFGLDSLQGGSERGSYGAASGSAAGGAAGTAAGTSAGGGASDRDRDHETAASGSAVGDDDRESSTSSAGEETHPEGSSSSSATHADDQETSSSGGTFETQREDAAGTGAEPGERREASGAAAGSDEPREGSGTTESSQQGGAGSRPSTSKQTEETETFQEGGRTKIRRRIIREEVVDADDE